MRLSDYPDDIQQAAGEAAGYVESDGMPGGGYSWASIEVAIAEAIKSERDRCVELAHEHALYNPDCKASYQLHQAIKNGGEK